MDGPFKARQNGYQGIFDREFMTLGSVEVSGRIRDAGTILSTSRCLKFKEEAAQKDAIEILKKENIQALLVLGGDGSLAGAAALSRHGYRVLGLPCSIDNDIPDTQVGIIDSDFFILNNYILNYVDFKFKEGFQAVGCEYNDGKDTKQWVNINPTNFENIPCCFGAYYNTSLARSASWIITEQEVNEGRSTGFVEVGSKIRRYILDNKIKTCNWKTDAQIESVRPERNLIGFAYSDSIHSLVLKQPSMPRTSHSKNANGNH